jgi:S1-C subfamily serine protease
MARNQDEAGLMKNKFIKPVKELHFPFLVRNILVSIALPSLVFLSAVLPSSVQAQQRTVTEVARASLDSVVLVVVSVSSGAAAKQESGFIVSPDGVIVTNSHVISGAESGVVKLTNGAMFQVEGVLAENEDEDIGVIAVSGRNLPYLKLGDSDVLSPGDHVVAIGSPLGLQSTVTDGIVSAVRKYRDGRKWIQTTAPASEGNSGGPLLDMDGRVVGIVTLKLTSGENLNFAIPINEVKPLLASAREPHPLGPAGGESSGSKGAREAPPEQGRIWRSETSGKEYRLWIKDKQLHAEWTNIPPEFAAKGAYIRSVSRRVGSKWVGESHSYLPCSMGNGKEEHIANFCHLTTGFKLDSMTDKKITGRGEALRRFDCKTCKVLEKEWKDFVWVPKPK